MRIEKWFKMEVGTQLANVGGEINRVIRWKNRGIQDHRKSGVPE